MTEEVQITEENKPTAEEKSSVEVAPKKDDPLDHQEKKKLTPYEKLTADLADMEEKVRKADAEKSRVIKRADDLTAKMETIKQKLHDIDDAELMKACNEKGLTYKQLTEFVKSIPADYSADDVVGMFK